MCCCGVLNILPYGSELTQSLYDKGVPEGSDHLNDTAELQPSLHHLVNPICDAQKQEKSFDLAHALVWSFCCVVAIKGTSSEGEKGLLECGAADSMPTYWINAVGGQQNWEISVFTLHKDIFFVPLPFTFHWNKCCCFIQKGFLFNDIFLSCHLACWVLAAVCSW